MCGIVAIFDPGQSVAKAGLRAGVEALRHRGPDQEGWWTSPCGQVGLGHARLAIIDLETGGQPLLSSDGQIALVANGEFYDHDRLLELLASRGHQVTSRSDSEVALHLYRELGEGLLTALRGEFAFVLWDASSQRLIAARDRFGIKPLFYARLGRAVLLASEVKALWAAGLPRGWDTQRALAAIHMVAPQEDTLFAGVHQVPPGCFLRIDEQGLEVVRYWDCDYPSGLLSKPRENDVALVAETSRHLHEAVRLRTRSDVRMACYLSGGVDSASVLGIAQRYRDEGLTAFTIAFDDARYDESAQAAEMARFCGARFEEVRVSSADLAQAFIPTVLAGEGLVGNGHAPARFLLSQAVSRAGFKVALGGEGADELFAGYRFAEIALQSSARAPSLTSMARKLLMPWSSAEAEIAAISKPLAVLLRAVGFPTEIRDYLLHQLRLIRALVIPEALGGFHDPFAAFLRTVPWPKLVGRETVKALLYLWTRTAFVNYVLAAERLDMAHGVELRLPFLDHRLFEWTRQLPARALYQGQEGKAHLRQAVAPYVTPSVRAGRKRPFIAPPSRRLQAHLKEIIDGGPTPDFLSRAALLALLQSEEPVERMEPTLCMVASLCVLQDQLKL